MKSSCHLNFLLATLVDIVKLMGDVTRFHESNSKSGMKSLLIFGLKIIQKSHDTVVMDLSDGCH